MPNSGPARAQVKQLVWDDLTGAAGELAPGAGLEVQTSFSGIEDTSFLLGSVTAITATVSGMMADADGAGGTAPRFLPLLPDQPSQASVQIVNPTAVQGVSGQARETVSGVELSWQTQDETDVVGFNVVRTGVDGEKVLNSELLLAQVAGQAAGWQYSFIDSYAESGASYGYLLQIVHIDREPTEFVLGSVNVRWHLFLSQISR